MKTKSSEALSRKPVYRFNYATMSWDEHKWWQVPLTSYKMPRNYNKGKLVVVTYNVLCDIFSDIEKVIHSPIRFNHQLTKLLPSTNADVIALQEVTFAYLEKLLAQEWVRTNYFLSHYEEVKVRSKVSHTMLVVILSKVPIIENYLYYFNPDKCQNAPRPATICVVPCPGSENTEKLVLVSFHLKAGAEFSKTRQTQFDMIANLIGGGKKQPPDDKFASTCNHCILLGDTNMTAEEQYINSKFVDVWPTLMSEEDGFTYDYKTNSIVTKIKQDDTKQIRFDRILSFTSSQVSRWIPVNTIIFGKENISTLHPYLTCSDHYALAAQFEYECTNKIK
ncbi:tyrosyl-DNA phosphodiesterase [Acrasis kona]|uniref:Tyrosyl-DNA phosphodiesterase n=1 Tax=Acrasis kona TaxID=1008807 RepID=A0AAW2ZFC6_9EUKA